LRTGTHIQLSTAYKTQLLLYDVAFVTGSIFLLQALCSNKFHIAYLKMKSALLLLIGATVAFGFRLSTKLERSPKLLMKQFASETDYTSLNPAKINLAGLLMASAAPLPALADSTSSQFAVALPVIIAFLTFIPFLWVFRT